MSDTLSDTKPAGGRLRKEQMRALVRSIGMLPVLIILGLLIQAAGVYFTGEGRFLSWQNLSIVAQQASINAVLGGRDDVRDPDRGDRSVGWVNSRGGGGRRAAGVAVAGATWAFWRRC